MINLNEKDKFKIKRYIVEHDISHYSVNRFNLSNGSFYVKYCTPDEGFREMLGKRIFDIAGIKCPDYKYYKELHCVVSEDLNSFGKFIYMSNFPFIVEDTTYRRISFGILVDAVCNYFDNKDEIYYQVAVMHFIDILFSNIDRHLNNYGVYVKENKGILSVFDNGMLLNNFDCITKPQSCISDKMFFTKMIECDHFIKNLPLKYRLKLYELYLKFTPDFVKELIDNLENESGIEFISKKSTLLKYYKNYLFTGFVLSKHTNMCDRREIVKLNKMKYAKI